MGCELIPAVGTMIDQRHHSMDGLAGQPHTLGEPIVRMGSVTSTMDIARRLEALGADEGIAVIAGSQTQGRGRAGRSWQSPESAGLYCSILLRPNIPPRQFQPFSIAVGLAICDALDPGQQVGLQLKWPNDIIYQGQKLAGILLTTSLAGAVVESAILGIGLNLRPASVRPEHAISLSEIPAAHVETVENTFRSIARAIGLRYDAVIRQDIERALSHSSSRLAYLGRRVTIEDGSMTHTGKVIGIDDRGALLIDTASGPVAVSSGELTRGPFL